MSNLPIAEAAALLSAGIEIGPRMYPCVCGAGRHAHGGSENNGASKETGCRRYRSDRVWDLAYAALDADAVEIGAALEEADKRQRAKHYRINPRKPGEWSIGASDTTTCPRKIQYRNAPPEGFVPLPESSGAARIGSLIHEEATRQLRSLYPWRIYKMKVRIRGLDRESELDAYDPITGVVDDIKTAGDWRWDQLADDGPEWEVWEQVLMYGLALEDAGYLVTKVRLSYIKRCNGLDEVFTMEYDRAAAERARDRLLGYAEMLDLGMDLPKTGTGPTNDALCRMCMAREDCWNITAATAAGRSPESFTILGQWPDEPDVIWAIEQKVTASAERLAADKAEDKAKALVEGLEPGRFGETGQFEVYRQWQAGKVSYKAYVEALIENDQLPEEERVSAETIKPPKGKGYEITKVGRTRKAILDKERRERAALEKAAKAVAKTAPVMEEDE